ncbi:NAD(P)-binding protein [Flavobacterium sp. DSP2-3-1]
MNTDHIDIVIIGAGLSGIGAAWHLSSKNPDKNYVILKARAELG